MILQQLTLRNFGVYQGEQVFDLSPGAGAQQSGPDHSLRRHQWRGKTTILDAIQLVLYGNRARCSKRGDKPYDEFLAASVHHGTPSGEGAAIELAFRFAAEGEEHLYDVTRSWSTSRDRLQERVLVTRDGEPDGWLSDNWHQVVEELIPFGIASSASSTPRRSAFWRKTRRALSAGGGHQVASGAGSGRAAGRRRVVAGGRLALRSRKSPDLAEVERLEGELAAKQAEIEALHQAKGAIENPRQVAAHPRQGGRRTVRQSRRQAVGNPRRAAAAARRVGVSVARLRRTTGGTVGRRFAAGSGRQPAQRRLQPGPCRARRPRDGSRLPAAGRSRPDGCRVAEVRKCGCRHDRAGRKMPGRRSAQRTAGVPENGRVMLSDGGREMLEHLVSRGLDERRATASQWLTELDTGRRALEEVQRSLAATPDEESIRGVAEELKKAASEAAVLDQQAERMEIQLASLRYEHGAVETVLQRLRRKVVDEEIRTEEEGRVAGLLQRTQETMRKFLQLATNRKIDRLSELVTESFRFLLRKKTLVQRVAIDPQTFAITLIDSHGRSVAKERLSEGEKQIFAISVLWGLSRASAGAPCRPSSTHRWPA